MKSYAEYLAEAWYDNTATQGQEEERVAAANTAQQQEKRIVVIGDSIAVGIGGASEYAQGGISTAEVLNRVKAFVATGKARGATVILSSGASNSAPMELEDGKKLPGNLSPIETQVKTLVNAGAAVALVGTGSKVSTWFPATRYTNGQKYRVDLTGVNDMLSNIAKSNGATFLGPLENYDSGLHTGKGDGIHPFGGYKKLYQDGSKVGTTAPATTTAEKPQAGGAAQPATADVDQSVEKFSPKTKELQTALLDAGFELPKHGADGRLGPETRKAIRAAEQALGREPTGTVTVDELKSLKDKDKPSGGAAQAKSATDDSAARLQNALGAIEALLSKYKIQSESVDRELVLANINKFNLAEQVEIHKELIAEADKPKLPPGAKFDRATGNWYTTSPTGAKSYIGGATGAKPAEKFNLKPQSKWSKWASKLAPSLRRAGAKSASGLAAAATPTGVGQAVGIGLNLWAAYDIAKGIYDIATQKGLEDFSEEDQAVLADHLETIMEYTRDPELAKALTPELKARLERVVKGLKELELDLEEPETAQPKKNPFNPSGVGDKYDITPDEAKAALENGSPRDIEALGGRAFLQRIASGK